MILFEVFVTLLFFFSYNIQPEKLFILLRPFHITTGNWLISILWWGQRNVLSELAQHCISIGSRKRATKIFWSPRCRWPWTETVGCKINGASSFTHLTGSYWEPVGLHGIFRCLEHPRQVKISHSVTQGNYVLQIHLGVRSHLEGRFSYLAYPSSPRRLSLCCLEGRWCLFLSSRPGFGWSSYLKDLLIAVVHILPTLQHLSASCCPTPS